MSNLLDVKGLTGAISRPLGDGNGTYTVVVAMHPGELGHVEAVMSLAGNDLQVSITPHTRIGHDALANAADTLKNELARGGVNVNVTLRDPGSPSGGEGRYPAAPTRGVFTTPDDTTTPAPLPAVLRAGQVHLIL